MIIISILKNLYRTLFTENETNTERLYGQPNKTPFVKDAFHTAVISKNLIGWKKRKKEQNLHRCMNLILMAQSSVTIKLAVKQAVIDTRCF